jgi:hypothetical protein
MFKRPPRVCVHKLLVSSDPLFIYSISFFSCEETENTNEGHDDPESSYEGDIHLEYSSG